MSAILFSPGSRTWLLSMPHSSYALRLDPEDVPCHLHWGAVLTSAQAEELTLDDGGGQDSFSGRLAAEELTVDGGARYGVAGLQVRFADGTRAVEWAYVGHEITEDQGGAELALRMRDRLYPLTITLHYRVHHDSDVIDRHVTLAHTDAGTDTAGDNSSGTDTAGDVPAGREPIEILRADSAGYALPPRADYRLTHVVGGWAAESRPRHDPLPWGETVLTSRRGITGHHANPWIMIDDGDAGERHGRVYSAALAWSGSWRITVARTPDNRVRFTGGHGHDGVSWHLDPGQQLTTPVLSGLCTEGGYDATSQAWHTYIRNHVLPHAQEDRPVLYNSWEATGFDLDEANQRRLATHAAKLGVELFVMDDGWFGARTSDRAGLGDWQPNPGRFPNGLTPLIDHVHGLGMKFGLWVEPEMVNADSDLYRQHPDWIIHHPHRSRTELRNQHVLNLANPDVAAWAHGWLDRLLTEHAIDFLKWDMNRAFTEPGWPGHGDPDRLWIDHVHNVYTIIDKLRADHPHLRIEGCAGGGGRVDLGMLGHVDQVWPSDNTDALDRLTIQDGATYIYPARVLSSWITDSPNPLTGRAIPLRFRAHTAMAGLLAVGADLTTWTDAELDELARYVAQYKEIRPTIQHGTRHRLTGSSTDIATGATGTTGTTAVQYTSADHTRTVVIAWQPTRPLGQRPAHLRLTDLDPGTRYRNQETGDEYDAALLLEHGIPLDLPRGDYASTLVILDTV